MKGHKVALGGSFSGNTSDLFKNLPQDDILQFSLCGREVQLQVKSEKLDDVIKSLNKLGVSNLSILEWRKYGTTVAGSGSSIDEDGILNISLIPSALGDGLRPLSVTQRLPLDRKLYIEMLANLEAVLLDAGVSEVLYAVQIEKDVGREDYINAVRDAALNALFNSGGVVGIE
ncbi:MAG: hypothetical protein GF416_09270 [Candidatus Altiarchaeales archaeon]|nr:hypothetical protein [Candidatus Altiarchaeales archaeon]MBD3417309.1 hypothetical protein [Candidatus Altiarchaeales archaeon]